MLWYIFEEKQVSCQSLTPLSKAHHAQIPRTAALTMKLIIVAGCLMSVVLGATVYSHIPTDVPAYRSENYEIIEPAPKPYSFAYSIKNDESYLNYGRQETSDGKTVRGSYHVLLPDGRLQKVTYKADSNGYVADVTYENSANYS